MKAASSQSIDLAGRRVAYRVVRSVSAKKMRIRVGPNGVEVIQPKKREVEDIEPFLVIHEEWILEQLRRVERLRGIRKPRQKSTGQILYRGVPTTVRVEDIARRERTNQVIFEPGSIVIARGRASQTPPAQTLENWLRRQARGEIEQHLTIVGAKLKRNPHGVYVRGQRTKWGNCSKLQNLSFNWRIILAPDFVLRYLVTHEAVHLAVPDHSQRFWLTVQSLCPEMERAKQWLCTNAHQLMGDLERVCPE